jgi:hypothetical protein
MIVDRVPGPQKSCVRAYSFAARNEGPRAEDREPERSSLFWPPVESVMTAEVESSAAVPALRARTPCGRSSVLSARVATIVRCGPMSDGPRSLTDERAASRRGMASPARISVCLSEFTLTAGF